MAPRIPRLERLVGDGGILYDPADPAALARAIADLADAQRRAILGAAARTRVVEHFSWEAHCRRLDAAIAQGLSRR